MIDDRRDARQVALQALFEADQASHDPWPAMTARLDEKDLSPDARELAISLVRGVLDHKEQIDAIIGQVASTWPVEQVAVTDRVALEIGIFEVCVDRNVPLRVAINEAVELAKVFGGENSAGFVNGVLRTIAEREAAHSHS